LFLLAPLTGCGGGPPAPADPERARTALTETLDAWKGGQSIEDLKNRRPAIHVSDVQWRNALRLVAYRILDDGNAQGANLSCQVELSLQDAAGQTFQETAIYNVGTDPALVVVRDFETGAGMSSRPPARSGVHVQPFAQTTPKPQAAKQRASGRSPLIGPED
jgi:hypothetical protein